jgi:hypothetical protein
VFELSGILWFYSDVDGTQSLSVTLGTAEADKLNPGPLFKAICAGFASWEWADGPGQTPGASGAQPPNNCFIECLAILRQRTALGADLHNSRLLFYYVGATPGRAGHTVLLFDCDRGLTAVDPDQPDRDIRIPAFVCADLRSIARYLRKGEVESARTLSIKDFGRPPPGPNWAALPRTGPATG